MAASEEKPATSHGVVLWVEWPAGCWNAVLQVAKSPPKGDLKVDPFRGKMTEADGGAPLRTVARVLAEESHSLFDFDAQQLAKLVGTDSQSVFHFRLQLPDDAPVDRLAALMDENAAALSQPTDAKGLAIVFVPLSAPKAHQPTKISISPYLGMFHFFIRINRIHLINLIIRIIDEIASKIFNHVGKIAPMTLPTLQLTLDSSGALKRLVLRGDEEAAAAAGEVTDRHRVAEAELAWRYSPAIYAQVETASKPNKAQLLKALKQRREQTAAAASAQSSRSTRGGGAAGGPQRGKAKPTSKPKATSC